MLLLIGCTERFTPPTDELLLPIPNRAWAEGAPPEGWCGEASIQMVALYYGDWLPQRWVHGLVPTKHADLWEDEMPAAMTAAGFDFETFSGTSEPKFLQWIISQLKLGRPVIVGVKLVPDEHPDWEVDHLMPIVGYSPEGLVFDTNLEQGQQRVPFARLKEVLLLTTKKQRWFGWAVKGTPSPLRVVGEADGGVKLQLGDGSVFEVSADAPFTAAAPAREPAEPARP